MNKETNSMKNFVILEKWMAEDLDVNITELVVFAVIYSFNRNEKGTYYAGIELLKEYTNRSDRCIKYALKSLIEKNYIRKTKTQDKYGTYNRYEIPTSIKKTRAIHAEKVCKNCNSDVQNLQLDGAENASNNIDNIIYNKQSIISKDIVKLGVHNNVILNDESLKYLERITPELNTYIQKCDQFIEDFHLYQQPWTQSQYVECITNFMKEDGVISD